MNAKSEVKNAIGEVSEKVDAAIASHEQSRLLSDTAEQLQKATDAICNLVTTFSSATSGLARAKFNEGKEKVAQASHKVESVVIDRPLVSIGVAFAAGWLVSRLMKSSS